MITLPGTLSTPAAGPILTRGASARYANGGRVTVLGVESTHAHVYDGAADRRVYAPLDALSLDLESDLGPTIALRWLGRHYGIDVGIGCPEWSRFGGASPVWRLHTAKVDLWFASGGRSAVDRCATNIFGVPGISAITDPLEALVAACLHAAGVPRE